MQLFDSDMLTLDPDVYHTYFGLLDIYLLSYNSVSRLQILKCNMMLYCMFGQPHPESLYIQNCDKHMQSVQVIVFFSFFSQLNKRGQTSKPNNLKSFQHTTSYRQQTFRNFVWMHFCLKKKIALAFSSVFDTESHIYIFNQFAKHNKVKNHFCVCIYSYDFYFTSVSQMTMQQ